MNPALEATLATAERVLESEAPSPASGKLRAGVDLGTACFVLVVVDDDGTPVAGSYEWADVVRDGVVLDFVGASALVREHKRRAEQRLGVELTGAATAYPPGVPLTEVRATRYVLESAGLECTAMVDEPTAANALLGVTNGAVVDVGGGTTGIAIVEDGQVVYTADEPTGGTHFTLVIAGAHGIDFASAERLKRDPAEQRRLLPVVRPVMEKVAFIVTKHLLGHGVEQIYLVGGTCAFPGIARVISEITEVPAVVPGNPLFVTPLGIALSGPGIERNSPVHPYTGDVSR